MSFKSLSSALLISFSAAVYAAPVTTPILVVGGSLENGKTPCEIGKVNVLGCISVGFGHYLSLGQAIARSNSGIGLVFNEAIAGATTFNRSGYIIPGEDVADVGWENHGYENQFARALAQVTNPVTGDVSAKHVVIGIGNDCLHSNAFVTPPSQSSPCTRAEINSMITRYIQIGQMALDAGVTPVYTLYPPRKTSEMSYGWDLALSQQVLGFSFVICDADYDFLAKRFKNRIKNELPGALRVNSWKDIVHMGDGLHPTIESSQLAAKRVMRVIKNNQPLD
jgi:hypothetical protein